MSLRVRSHRLGGLGKSIAVSFWRQWTAGKWAGAFLMLTSALLVIACQKVPSDPESAAKEAVRLYPALGVKDSTFNKTYLRLYREAVQKDPSFLQKTDWPLELAQRTAGLLGVQPATDSLPSVAAIPVTPAPVTPPQPTPAWNPLDRGSWREGTTVVKGTPWIRRY